MGLDAVPGLALLSLALLWGAWLLSRQYMKLIFRTLHLYETGNPLIQEYLEFRALALATNPAWVEEHLS
ncbi:hypothetical protein ACOTC5_30060 [Achromobacter xylosoxidans]